jgi:hypothetical protein
VEDVVVAVVAVGSGALAAIGLGGTNALALDVVDDPSLLLLLTAGRDLPDGFCCCSANGVSGAVAAI